MNLLFARLPLVSTVARENFEFAFSFYKIYYVDDVEVSSDAFKILRFTSFRLQDVKENFAL